jgi:hypothetical protein
MRKQTTPEQKPKHVLSVMRKIIGASLNDSKEVLGFAPDTIKSIQSGRLPFSEQAALVVSHKTGVSCKWLLAMDGSKPPETESGERFTKETFDKHEAARDKDVREWSSPANRNYYRYDCLKQFRTLTAMLAGLVLAAHTSRKVGFINAKITNEMRRLASLLRQIGVTAEFERRAWKEIGDTNAESEAGLIAVFNLLKKELPAEKEMIWPLPPPQSNKGKVKAPQKPAKPPRR